MAKTSLLYFVPVIARSKSNTAAQAHTRNSIPMESTHLRGYDIIYDLYVSPRSSIHAVVVDYDLLFEGHDYSFFVS